MKILLFAHDVIGVWAAQLKLVSVPAILVGVAIGYMVRRWIACLVVSYAAALGLISIAPLIRHPLSVSELMVWSAGLALPAILASMSLGYSPRAGSRRGGRSSRSARPAGFSARIRPWTSVCGPQKLVTPAAVPHWRRGILNAYQERALPRAAATAVVIPAGPSSGRRNHARIVAPDAQALLPVRRLIRRGLVRYRDWLPSMLLCSRRKRLIVSGPEYKFGEHNINLALGRSK
jgi:hypothetical protein